MTVQPVSKEELLQQFRQWVAFVQSLETADERWNIQLGDGKWSVREVVSHIALWDKYFLEEAIDPIHNSVPLTVKHLDYDAFNENAKQYGKRTSPSDLSEQAISYRLQIIQRIEGFSQSVYEGRYVDADGHPFVLEQYLKDFLWHDNHHMDQMRSLS